MNINAEKPKIFSSLCKKKEITGRPLQDLSDNELENLAQKIEEDNPFNEPLYKGSCIAYKYCFFYWVLVVLPFISPHWLITIAGLIISFYFSRFLTKNPFHEQITIYDILSEMAKIPADYKIPKSIWKQSFKRYFFWYFSLAIPPIIFLMLYSYGLITAWVAQWSSAIYTIIYFTVFIKRPYEFNHMKSYQRLYKLSQRGYSIALPKKMMSSVLIISGDIALLFIISFIYYYVTRQVQANESVVFFNDLFFLIAFLVLFPFVQSHMLPIKHVILEQKQILIAEIANKHLQ